MSKCLACKVGKLKVETFLRQTNRTAKDKGILMCDTCGHKERFL